MERTVPKTASEEIELYIRTMYSLLRSTTRIQMRTLEEVHAGTNSSLHPHARNISPDMSAFIYSLLRLPSCVSDVQTIVLGQSPKVFERQGYQNVESWQAVSASARRRRCFYDGQDILACFIASRSDIDDMLPALTAYQIEWNKIHFFLQDFPADLLANPETDLPKAMAALAKVLMISPEDLNRLQTIWKDAFFANLRKIAARECDFKVRLLSSSFSEYRRSTNTWWSNIERAYPDLVDRPVYFISSNNHSLRNVMVGFALQHKDELIDYVEKHGDEEIRREWEELQDPENITSKENFFYYMLKKYQQTPQGMPLVTTQSEHEKKFSLLRIPSEHSFDVEAQIIPLANLEPSLMDPRLTQTDLDFLRQSDAVILNIDYPLGLAASNILGTASEHINQILGIYIMGKAATLNGVIGDVMIPNVVHDEHSENTYLFQNCFSAADISQNLAYGTVLDNQKAFTVLGTFLQNAKLMDVFYREGYTDIEMEAGPYLSALYEMSRPRRHPVNEIVNLYAAPYDLGILHYASDTPLSKGKNLGAGTLSYYGMDSTYACTTAIVNRILKLERDRVMEIQE